MAQALPQKNSDLGLWLSTRLGYGGPNARVIFLGQDEAMENLQGVPDEFLTRLYEANGQVAAPWDDIVDCHQHRLAPLFQARGYPQVAARMRNLVNPKAPGYQATWARLGAFLHGLFGLPKMKGTEMIGCLLSEVIKKNVALAEWWPMPAPSGVWPYSQAASVAQAAGNRPNASALSSRRSYEQHCEQARINAIQTLVNAHHPYGRIIVGYTDPFGQQRAKVALAAQPIQAPLPRLVRGAWRLGTTLLVWVYHPNARGGMNAGQLWVDLGAWAGGLYGVPSFGGLAGTSQGSMP